MEGENCFVTFPGLAGQRVKGVFLTFPGLAGLMEVKNRAAQWQPLLLRGLF